MRKFRFFSCESAGLERELFYFLVVLSDFLLQIRGLLVSLGMQLELVLEIFGGLGVFLGDLTKLMESFSVLSCVENFIKYFFQVGLVRKWPVRLVLMAKYHVLEN